MSHTFISYKSEDAARVTRLVLALKSSGLEIWWARYLPEALGLMVPTSYLEHEIAHLHG